MGQATNDRNMAIGAIVDKITTPRTPVPPKPPTDSWRNIPLSLGLLVVIILAVVWGIDKMHDYSEASDVARQRSIAAHNRDEGAHPGIRHALDAMERRMTKRVDSVGANVDELRADVKKLLRQPRRHRR